jgi:hypothetical protein
MNTSAPATPTPTAKPTVSAPEPTHLAESTNALTRQQRDALFDNASNGMTPDHQKKKKPEDPVRPWIPQILRKHKQGFSSQQIAAMSRAPGIGLNLSVRAVNRVIVQHKKAAKPGTK